MTIAMTTSDPRVRRVPPASPGNPPTWQSADGMWEFEQRDGRVEVYPTGSEVPLDDLRFGSLDEAIIYVLGAREGS